MTEADIQLANGHFMQLRKEFDGRGEHTTITKLAETSFNILSPEILISKIYKENFDIASAAPLVLTAAEDNDKIALEIIDKETEALFLHVLSMFKKLNQPSMELAFIGGLISSDNIFQECFATKFQKLYRALN